MSAAPMGRLLLVPNTLDLGAPALPLEAVLPLGVIQRVATVLHWVVEDARSARSFLKRVDALAPLIQPLQTIDIRELPRPRKGSNEVIAAAQWLALLAPALAGADIGLLSDTGLPAVADPGAWLVQAAHTAGVPVVALPGASSLLLALAASGLNGQSFAFVGYLPQEAAARTVRIKELEALSKRTGQTQLMIETPYRNNVLLVALLAALAPATKLSVSYNLTLPDALTRSDTVARWKAQPSTLPDRGPAVFSLLA